MNIKNGSKYRIDEKIDGKNRVVDGLDLLQMKKVFYILMESFLCPINQKKI